MRDASPAKYAWYQAAGFARLTSSSLIKEAALRIIGTFAAAAARASTMSPRYAHSAADPNGGMPNGAA